MKPIPSSPGRTEQAYQALLDEICEGSLSPGIHLVQEELATRLGVSRQPIQQAMALLKNDGLVEEIGTRGLRVAPLDPAVMHQHYEIRQALDVLAVRLAAARAAAAADTARDIDRRGRSLIEDGRAAAASGSVRRMVHCDVEFHRFLYAVSGNPLLAQTAEPHWRYLRRVMADVLRHAEPGATIWSQHAGILAAVVAGDGNRAVELAATHVEGAAERLAVALSRSTNSADQIGREKRR